MTTALRIDFVSDIVCPWCVIGMKSLERALAGLPDVAPEWHFHPFELNPAMPPEGENAAEHVARKYGRPPEDSAAARGHIRQMGADLGFSFAGGPDAMIWNTFDCHRLLHWAERAGQKTGNPAHALKTALFEAHFTHGQPLNDAETLIAAAATAGLEPAAAKDVLDSGRYADEVRAGQRWWREEQDISAVPAIVFNGKYAVLGGQPPATFENVIRRIVAGEI
jgi:predicted DsbA family dithiol-disulfide isomerase